MAATAWKRILKWSSWLLAGTIAVPIAAYVGLTEPSENDVIRFVFSSAIQLALLR